MTEPTVVAVDQGKSGTRAEARLGSGARVHSAGPGLSLTRGTPPGSSGVDAVIDAVRNLRLPEPPDVVSVGTTAAPGTQDERHELAETLRRRLGAGRVLVTEDAVTAHLGAFRGAAGVVVSAGTGAIALWSDGETYARIDGWGPVLGDHGSGAAIGVAGLRAAFAALDGRGPATTLTEQARDHLGGLDLNAARRLHASANPTEIVAEFAVSVLHEASSGDVVAGAIAARAAADLAQTAGLAAGDAVGARCCAVGQIMTNALLRRAFTAAATRHGLVVGEALGGCLDGAKLLAEGRYGRAFDALVGVAEHASVAIAE
jgi:N-acetylglucosamine kinase-like BadF-type ATPase